LIYDAVRYQWVILFTVNGYRNNHHQQNGHHQSNNVSTQSQHGAGDGPPQPKMVLYELKHVNVEWPSSIKRVGVGLSNLSNTCFLNSVLQCLLHTPPLAHYMSTPHHKKECKLQIYLDFLGVFPTTWIIRYRVANYKVNNAAFPLTKYPSSTMRPLAFFILSVLDSS